MSEGKSKKKLYIIIGVVVLAIIAVVSVFVVKTIKTNAANEKKYKEAKEMLEWHRYMDAKTKFEELGDYKDSKMQAEQCLEYRNAEMYKTGMECLNGKNLSHEEAIDNYICAVDMFMELMKVEYADSAELYEQATEMLNEAYYDYAKLLIEQRDFDKASLYLGLLDNYKDSADLLNKISQSANEPGSKDIDALKECKAGDEVFFGNYKTPICWQVLDRQGDSILLLSKYVLTESKFCEDGENRLWGQGILYEWLNGEFYESAFAEDEKSWIVESEVSDTADTKLRILEAKPVKCKIFLLSCEEVFKYMKSPVTRITTDASGEKKGWWLRSSLRAARQKEIYASYIEKDGTMYVADSAGNVFGGYEMNGVRPVIWVDVSRIY